MRILMISDTEAKGGAAIAAARMARALHKGGHEVGMVVNDPQEGPSSGPWQRFVVRSSTRCDWSAVPDAGRERQALGQLAQALDDFSPEAVSVHNVHGGGPVGWSVDMVRMCADRYPTVWTLHDTWSFTGRCAYVADCALFPDRCGSRCPSADEYPFLAPDRIADASRRKRDVIDNARFLAAAAPSRWMAGAAVEGGWAAESVHVLPNCLDLERYRPMDKAEARQELGIDREARVLLLCAADFNDPRKGMALALRALERVGERPLTLLVMGRGGDLPEMDGIAVRTLGFVGDAADKARAYSAADVMVHPALEDNLPNAVLESLACGTAVAGFSIGGMPELVADGRTGRLASDTNPESLALAIDECMAGSGPMGRAARIFAEDKGSEKTLAAHWADIVRRLRERDRGNHG